MARRGVLAWVTVVLLVAVAGCGRGEGVHTKLKLVARARPSGNADPDAEWAELCRTPGRVAVADWQELWLTPLDKRTFGDAELQQLADDFAGLTSLTDLSLAGTRVTDGGLASLAELPRLRWLNLWGCTDVSDAGLPSLAALRNLRSLTLWGCTGVTDKGAAALGRELPRCEVTR